MTIKKTRSESILHTMHPKKSERRDQFAVAGSKNRGRLLRKLDGVKEPSGEGEFMREKYPSALLQRPLVVEYYKLNDLAGDESIRLPPRLPTNPDGGESQDPRFTSLFGTFDHEQKVEELERYAQEIRWFIGRISKVVAREGEDLPLHTAMYRIFLVLQEPEYRCNRLSADDRKLLYDCCVESFMQKQQEYAECAYLDSA